jgi:hypothetical protein
VIERPAALAKLRAVRSAIVDAERAPHSPKALHVAVDSSTRAQIRAMQRPASSP